MRSSRGMAPMNTSALLPSLTSSAAVASRASLLTAPQRLRNAAERFREAARQSAATAHELTTDLLEHAELEELGDLLNGALENVIVKRGRTPLAGRVRVVPHGMPANAGVAAA